MMAPLAVVILTYNEERHIARAIHSVRSFASEIFIIDSFSTDRTIALAQQAGAMVLQNKFINQAKQFQWALDTAPIRSEWIMRLDADEVIEADLAGEISSRLAQLPSDVVGINLKRKHIFMDRWIKHGGRYPLVLLRIWRKGHGRVEDRWMDEHVMISGGDTITFDGAFNDHNLNDLTYFTDKHNKYATREAIEVLNQRLGFMPREIPLGSDKGSRQAAMKRFLKEALYNRIPFQLSAIGYFLFRYIVQLGFIDGRPGLVYHVLQGFWYRFLVGAKVVELQQAVDGMTDSNTIRDELMRLTGLQLTNLPTPGIAQGDLAD